MRLLSINIKKKIPLKRVRSFENPQYQSFSLFREKGSMLTATKSQFMHNIEDLLPKRVTPVSYIDAVLFDATVVIQNQRKRVCNDMQEQFMKYTMSAVSKDASQIHLVFNRYMENSIKSQTRQKRYGKGHGPQVHNIAYAVIPNTCKGVLAVNENKSALNDFTRVSLHFQYQTHSS